MSYFVYILWSDTLGRYYTGHSQYHGKRTRQHRQRSSTTWSGQAQDWTEVYSQKTSTREDARSLEKKIKARGAKRFLEDQKRKEST